MPQRLRRPTIYNLHFCRLSTAVILALAIVSALQFIPVSAFAQSVGSVPVEHEYALIPSLEVVNIVLVFMAAYFFYALSQQLGPNRGGIGVGYIAVGIALLGATRIYYLTADRGVISVHDDTLGMWWHLIFVLAMASCIIGGKALSGGDDEREQTRARGTLKIWGVTVTIFTVVAFAVMQSLDQPFLAVFQDTIWATFGVQHFAAFVAAGLAFLHIVVSFGGNRSREDTSILDQLKLPLMITYGLFSLNHLWELVTESWQILVLEEAIIERTEQLMIFPAFLAVAYVGWKLWSEGRSAQETAVAAE